MHQAVATRARRERTDEIGHVDDATTVGLEPVGLLAHQAVVVASSDGSARTSV